MQTRGLLECGFVRLKEPLQIGPRTEGLLLIEFIWEFHHLSHISLDAAYAVGNPSILPKEMHRHALFGRHHDIVSVGLNVLCVKGGR